MSQSDFGDIDPSATTGTELANDLLEPWRDALHSMHKGGSRPSYAVQGMLWIDDSSTPWQLKLFDGTSDVVLATFDPSGHHVAVIRADTVNESTAGNGVTVDGVDFKDTAIVIGSPTGGNQGSGSLNAVQVFEAGVRVVKGPGSATDNAVARFDSNGHNLQNSGVLIDDDDNISGYGAEVVTKASDFTLAAADKGKILECTQASSNGEQTVTVPSNSSVALPVGYSVTLVQADTDTVVVDDSDSAVTVQSKDGNLKTDGQWAAATLYKRATDEWVLIGALTS